MSDLIKREDAIKAIHNYWKKRLDTLPTKESQCGEVYADIQQMDKILEHNKTLCNFINAIPSADRPQDDEFKNFDRESLILLIEAQKERIGELMADRPQGAWIKDNLGTVICSECKRPRRDNRINHINFCNSCGAQMKGADDEVCNNC